MDEATQTIIKQKFLEELNDVEKYLDLCKKATDDCSKQIFKDIAKDEMSHAEFLKDMIHKYKFTVTEAEHQKAQELYKKVKEEYQAM